LVYCCFSTFPSLNLHISHDMSYSCIMGVKEAKVRWHQPPSCAIFAVTWWNDRHGWRAIEMFWRFRCRNRNESKSIEMNRNRSK
jgi:hypothetical protein